MRTLIGLEAVDVAERLNLLLLDRYYKSEVTVHQAKLFIQQQRDPASFVLEDWPETDKEAEQIVLRQFHTALVTQQMTECRIPELWQVAVGPRPIHPRAADLAAMRLVEQQELELVEADEDDPVYSIPRTTQFTDAFLDRLRTLVCDDCSHLNPEQPFHNTCLMALVEYLINGDFSLNDVTEVRALETSGRRPNLLKPAINTRWLSHTVSATKSRLKSVVKPMLRREQVHTESCVTNVPHTQEPVADGPVFTPDPVEKMETQADRTVRNKISKQDLIRYLGSVEILDEEGELADLRQERDLLFRQVESKERELQQIERARAFLEKQCAEMQRDMDTLLQAMQIAKRRGHSSAQVIDGEISEPQAR